MQVQSGRTVPLRFYLCMISRIQSRTLHCAALQLLYVHMKDIFRTYSTIVKFLFRFASVFAYFYSTSSIINKWISGLAQKGLATGGRALSGQVTKHLAACYGKSAISGLKKLKFSIKK
jgi:hypothetical protein